MPMVIMVLAAGLIGYARLAAGLLPRPGGRAWLALAWLVAAAMGASACATSFIGWTASLRRSIGWKREEVWSWIRQVGPDDAVLADYEVSAPLSSRRALYSYILDANLPAGFPRLGPEFHWLFVKSDDP